MTLEKYGTSYYTQLSTEQEIFNLKYITSKNKTSNKILRFRKY